MSARPVLKFRTLDGPDERSSGVSRLTVLMTGAAAGGGLLLGLSLPLAVSRTRAGHRPTALRPMHSSISIRDGRVTLTIPQVEMGQGTFTSCPMLIAEEFGGRPSSTCAWHQAPPSDPLYANALLGF